MVSNKKITDVVLVSLMGLFLLGCALIPWAVAFAMVVLALK